MAHEQKSSTGKESVWRSRIVVQTDDACLALLRLRISLRGQSGHEGEGGPCIPSGQVLGNPRIQCGGARAAPPAMHKAGHRVIVVEPRCCVTSLSEFQMSKSSVDINFLHIPASHLPPSRKPCRLPADHPPRLISRSTTELITTRVGAGQQAHLGAPHRSHTTCTIYTKLTAATARRIKVSIPKYCHRPSMVLHRIQIHIYRISPPGGPPLHRKDFSNRSSLAGFTNSTSSHHLLLQKEGVPRILRVERHLAQL